MDIKNDLFVLARQAEQAGVHPNLFAEGIKKAKPQGKTERDSTGWMPPEATPPLGSMLSALALTTHTHTLKPIYQSSTTQPWFALRCDVLL